MLHYEVITLFPVLHKKFHSKQETRERVKLLIQLADSLVEKGHVHASDIKQWVAAVDKRYKDFSSRMDKYRYGDFLLSSKFCICICYIHDWKFTISRVEFWLNYCFFSDLNWKVRWASKMAMSGQNFRWTETLTRAWSQKLARKMAKFLRIWARSNARESVGESKLKQRWVSTKICTSGFKKYSWKLYVKFF